MNVADVCEGYMEGECGGDAEPGAGAGAGNDVRGAVRRELVDGLLLLGIPGAEPFA